ncbi:MarR family winged helix-turn-helix transcriptional regulator [Cellulomonas sp. PhB143]|uniref:MarR family winged helix-turn-helix transcriptional regulator n=1 Tax=Cellulomonas sp. PhB143 TaxID=2485186 RepID=UPI000F49F3BD|nr:MarR family transcriptional regulator [Cellulomonas sp. PhB143]ROS75318.1 DNA-binding MarR family transcriptional regulator [Cellulomonas sp. PhB143]
MDYVDRVREQWARRLPDLDASAAEVTARITRIAALLTAQTDAALAEHDLSRQELDVLTTVARAGRPLRPGEIRTIQRAPGASVTKRLAHLERAGLVERAAASHDRRGVLVSLTAAGEALVDRLFPEQVGREEEAISDLDDDDRRELARLLAVVLRRVDPTGR